MLMASTAVRTSLVAAVIASGVLGYGYWFGATHGSLYISADDVSDPHAVRPDVPLALTFFDRSGRELVKAETLPPWNTIVLTAPAAYSCHAEETAAVSTPEARARWQTCFARQSRWLTSWIDRVNDVTLETTRCRLEHVPVDVETHPDTWWLWWVPLPHIGGKPYTSFDVHLMLDVATCQIRSRAGRP
jgi:hypothetical protein